MKFTSTTDFESPLNFAFESFADFQGFEHHALRAGAQVHRIDDLAEPGRGMMWKVKAEFRGKNRSIEIELVDYEPHQNLQYNAVATGFIGDISVELLPLATNRTRATVTLTVKPTSLSARLLIQSARLAKTSINKRFRARLDKFGTGIEDNYRAACST